MSHFGPPTAPKITASAALAFSMVASVIGDPMGVVAAAADQRFLGGEFVRTLFVEEVDDALHLGHHFGADAVAGEKKQIVGRHRGLAVTDTARIANGPRDDWQGKAVCRP